MGEETGEGVTPSRCRGGEGWVELWGAAGERGKGQSVNRVHWSPKTKCKEVLPPKRPSAVFTKA